jgi:phosphatidylglycerophosphate synthase
MVAIESGHASQRGELYNDVPDRISDAATLIGAGYAAGGVEALGYLSACSALLTAYVRVLGKACGLPGDYCGPMAKQHRMALLTSVALYCALAPQSWRPGLSDSGEWGLVSVGLIVIFVGSLITAVRRLLHIATALQ